MAAIFPPAVSFAGRLVPGAELAGTASAWRAAIADEVGRSAGLVALPMASDPDTVAAFFALSSLSRPVVVLPSDLRGWRCSPALPAGTSLVLPPDLAGLRAEGERLGLRVIALPSPSTHGPAPDPAFMSCPGLVFFTSGSTGLPRPVYRTTAQVLASALAPSRALGFPPGRGVIGSLPLDRTFGMHHTLMQAALLGRPLALLRRFQPHAVLGLFASGACYYWAATPFMAEALVRCALEGPAPRAPERCIVSGRLSAPVRRAFLARFGVPLRELYGTTETGGVTVEAGAPEDLCPGSSGTPLPGMEIAVGDDPRRPLEAGAPGRVWIRGPGCAAGYGFPPRVDAGGTVDGWWPSPDIGRLGADGSLSLLGRADDCIRTASGHLVSPSAVAGALEAYPGVSEALVVPLGTADDPAVAAVVETAAAVPAAALREHLARALPPWSRPRHIAQTRALPRLASGKPDRRACIALARSVAAGSDVRG
jgi:acyl-CoA synthetase (AMP-forming)/AMP-acid ligase II